MLPSRDDYRDFMALKTKPVCVYGFDNCAFLFRVEPSPSILISRSLIISTFLSVDVSPLDLANELLQRACKIFELLILFRVIESRSLDKLQMLYHFSSSLCRNLQKSSLSICISVPVFEMQRTEVVQ